MTDLIIPGGIATAILGVVSLWIKEYFRYRARKTGNNPHPCEKHSVAIGKIETEIENIKDDIKEIKERLI